MVSSHKRLAQKAREIRKKWEPIIFKRTQACPPHGACEEIAEFQEQLVNELAKFEGHHRNHKEAAAQAVVGEPLRDNDEGTSVWWKQTVSESVREAGTFLGGAVLAYGAQVAAQTFDAQVNTSNVLMKPSNLVTVGGALGLPLLAIYKKGTSARMRMIELGAAAYFIPQAIQLARSMMATQQVRFAPMPVQPVAMPAYSVSPSFSGASTIF